MFTRLRDNLAEKLDAVSIAQEELRQGQAVDAVGWIRSEVLGREFVLFCGAGISIPGDSSAPSFIQLRDNLVLAITRQLCQRRVIRSRHEAGRSTCPERPVRSETHISS